MGDTELKGKLAMHTKCWFKTFKKTSWEISTDKRILVL